VSGENFFVTNSASGDRYLHSLRKLLSGAHAADFAVSYVKLGGWNLVQTELKRAGISTATTRVLATSQLGVTQPQAVEAIRDSGVLIRNYVGGKVFHAKAIIAYDGTGKPVGAIVGSANLSESALNRAVECGIRTTDPSVLDDLRTWFESLISDKRQTREFSDVDLEFLEQTWRTSSALRLRQAFETPIAAVRSGVIEVDPESLEDLFVTVAIPIATLNIDHAGNNIRNLHHLREVLREFPRLSANPRLAAKQRSDLRLLGLLARDNNLTALGREAKNRFRSEARLASLWCKWVARTPDAALDAINPRIRAFKRAADRFWTLREEVQRFFFDNLTKPSERLTLQCIELVCSGSAVVSALEIEDLRRLATVIHGPELPTPLRHAVDDYFENKGRRSWRDDDRRIVLEAWKEIAR